MNIKELSSTVFISFCFIVGNKLVLTCWDELLDMLTTSKDCVYVLKTLQGLNPYASIEQRCNSVDSIFKHTKKKLLKETKLILDFCLDVLNSLQSGKEHNSLLLKVIAGTMHIVNTNRDSEVQDSCLYFLDLYLSKIPNSKTKWRSKNVEYLVSTWSEFVRNILKHSYEDGHLVVALSKCIEKFYKMRKFLKVNPLKLKDIHQMVVSHSKFLEIMLSEDEEVHEKKGLF